MRSLALALVIIGLAACDNGESPLDHAEVRVSNETTFDLDSARVAFRALTEIGTTAPGSEQVLSFGPVPDGGTSPYRPLDGQFVYTYLFPQAYGVYDLPGVSVPLCAVCNPEGTFRTLSVGPGRYTVRLRLEPYEAAAAYLEDAVPSRPDASSDRVEIRVENRGAIPFESVTVAFPSGPDAGFVYEVEYGALDPGEASSYVAVPASYRYAPARVVVGSDTAEVRIVDTVGERLLNPGRYTLGLIVQRETAYRDLTEIVREGDS